MWSRSISAGRSKAASFLLAAALTAAAPAAADGQGVVPADLSRFPYVAALSRVTGDTRVYFCGGTLIAPDWILTAAHCFQVRGGARIGTSGLWVEVGASLLRDVPDEAQVRVARIYVHPQYDAESRRNDIALVRLDRPAGPLIADLASQGHRPEAQDATVVGFGALYEGGLALVAAPERRAQPLSRPLLQAAVSSQSAACVAQAGAMALDATRLCAGAGQAETCIGDSGSPLVVQDRRGADRVIGLVSFGSGCAVEQPVTVYTRVSAYAGWIAETMRQQ